MQKGLLDILFGRIRVGFFQNKICPFLAQGICIYVGHFFYVKNTVEPTPLSCPSAYKLFDHQHARIFLFATYLLCLVDVFFNRQSAYQWVQLFSSCRRLVPLFV
jgi:hypothetical protein